MKIKLKYVDMNDRQKAVTLEALLEQAVVSAKDVELAFEGAVEAAQARANDQVAKEFGLDGFGLTASFEEREPQAQKEVRSARGPAKSTRRNAPGDRDIQHSAPAPNDPGARLLRKAVRAGGGPRQLTADQIASRRLQGVYISKIRQVPKTRKPEFQRIVKGPGGRQAAIDAIDKYLASKKAGT